MPWKCLHAQDIGHRKEQQDRVDIITSRDASRHLVVVADGMGGYRHGALAAQTLIDTARACFHNLDPEHPRALLEQICYEAHRAIDSVTAGERPAPGSTCALLYLADAEATWAHVGDSRVYHFRQGKPLSCTIDHSLDALLAASPNGRPANLSDTMSKTQLYMRLGGDRTPQPDCGASLVEPDDIFLVCSDGFWGSVEPESLMRQLRGGPLGDNQATDFVALARNRGGASCDNISLVLAQWRPGFGSRLRGYFGRRR